MNMLFLGSLYPKDREVEIQKRSRYFDFAANTLQWALVEGFDDLANVQVITVPASKGIKGKFKGSYFSHKQEGMDCCIGYYDIVGLKQFIAARKIVNCVRKNNYNTDIIFIYSIQLGYLKAAYELKKNNPKSKVALLVPDLSEYMSGSTNKIYRLLKWIESKINSKYLKDVDAFVLLTETMKDRLGIGIRPYTVMEGIFNQDGYGDDGVIKEETKVILYTGNLDKRYGIMTLLEAFSKIKSANYRLWICGSGGATLDIIDASQQDNRITYLGILNRKDVLSLQKRVTLLVNPRSANEEYTKYSFPSKTMEYLASGTPTLMHKLECIPDEYKKHIYFFDNEDADGMGKKIVEICEKPQDELNQFGQKAAMFILNNKTNKQQCRKILDFINTIIN